MASCRSTSFYLAPGVYRKFGHYALAAVLPGGEIVEISHRKMVKELMREHPLWDGLVLCANRAVLGKSSIVDALINTPASVERWYIDERVIEGRRPTGRAYTLHRLAHGGVEAIGGMQQAMSNLLATSDPSVRRAAAKLIEHAGRNAAYRVSLALAAQGFLDAHTIANLLRTKTPYEHATFAPVDVEATRAAFAVMQTRYPNEYQACIAQMLDGSTLGPAWLGEYLSQCYVGSGLGTYHLGGVPDGRRAWMAVSKLYGLGARYGRNVAAYELNKAATLRGHYTLSGGDETAARNRLAQYMRQLGNGANLPEPAAILQMLRETPGVVPHAVLHDQRLTSDPATVHQLIMVFVGRIQPTGESAYNEIRSSATLGKPYPIFTQNKDERLLYETVALYNFTDEDVEYLLGAFNAERDNEKRRVLGGVLQIALHNGAFTAEGMGRMYTQLRALRGEAGSLEARLVESLLARRDLPVAVAEAHVREHMGEIEGVMRAVLSAGTSGFGGGVTAYPRKQTTDTYGALGVAFCNPDLLAASPYLREQARTFVQVGLHTVGAIKELSAKYGNGATSPSGGSVRASSIERGRRITGPMRTGTEGAETILHNVAEGLLACGAGSEAERGDALRTYTDGRRKVGKAEENTVLRSGEAMVIKHFSAYQPSKPCETLEELWRDYCSVYGLPTSVNPVRGEHPRSWYANVAVNPNVGPVLQKLAYEKADHLFVHDAFGNEIYENYGEVGHLHFLERVAGARGVEDDLREAALLRHLEKQPSYTPDDPAPYGGLLLAAQIASDSSATEKMLAAILVGIETRATKLTKNILENSGRDIDDRAVAEAQEIDLILHMIEGRALTGEAAAAWRRCEKLRSKLRETVEECMKKGAAREATGYVIHSDEHRHQKALANRSVVASLDEGRLEEMLTIFEREQLGEAHGSKAEQVVWPEQIASVKDLPGYGHLPFAGIGEFSDRIDGSDYRFPEAEKGAAKLARVETISSGGELRQNAEYMGNCTAGYARSISRGVTRIVAVYDTDGNCALNLSFERGRGGNGSCPPRYRPLVAEILHRLNEDGDVWALAEINTRFNGLGLAWEQDWEEDDWAHSETEPAEPLLQMGTESAEEARAWAIQERFDNER